MSWYKDKYGLTELGLFVNFVLVIIVLGVMAWYGITWGLKVNCRNIGKDSLLESRWTISEGCLVKVGDRWIDSGKVRYFPDGSIAPSE